MIITFHATVMALKYKWKKLMLFEIKWDTLSVSIRIPTIGVELIITLLGLVLEYTKYRHTVVV